MTELVSFPSADVESPRSVHLGPCGNNLKGGPATLGDIVLCRAGSEILLRAGVSILDHFVSVASL